MRLVPALEGVAELILLVDHDHNGAGQNAAMVCERRWRRPAAMSCSSCPMNPAGISTTW